MAKTASDEMVWRDTMALEAERKARRMNALAPGVVNGPYGHRVAPRLRRLRQAAGAFVVLTFVLVLVRLASLLGDWR